MSCVCVGNVSYTCTILGYEPPRFLSYTCDNWLTRPRIEIELKINEDNPRYPTSVFWREFSRRRSYFFNVSLVGSAQSNCSTVLKCITSNHHHQNRHWLTHCLENLYLKVVFRVNCVSQFLPQSSSSVFQKSIPWDKLAQVIYWPNVLQPAYDQCQCCRLLRGIITDKSSAVAEMCDRPSKSGGGCCAPFHGGAGSPSNTMSPGLRPTFIPDGILIHLAVWPQQTWAKNWLLCPFLGGGRNWIPI